ncbi:MAG: nitrile hydratase subunit alpha [Waterburya sp.]
MEIQVLEETANITYLVIPKKPEGSEELSEEALESVAGGDGFSIDTPLGVFGVDW